MRMKQITAATMQDALYIARRDLGEDAVLLETRKLAGNKGITVVFAIDESQDDFPMEDLADTPPPRPEPAATIAPPLAEKQMRKPELVKSGAPKPRTPAPAPKPEKAIPAYAISSAQPVLEVIEKNLTSHAVSDALKARIMEAAGNARVGKGELLDIAETVLAEALSKTLNFNPIRTGEKDYPAKALMLVGPHGAGKSSTIAKLATQLTLAKRKVVIISTDTEHLGANDTLQALTDILKCEFHIVEKRAGLRDKIKEYAGNAWVLIDSAGVNIYEFQQMKALGELAGLQDVEPILTYPGGLDAEEAQELAGVFSFLPVERLIVTRTDATRRLSSFFAVLSAGNYALANMTSSANPSEACNPLSAPALSRLMLRRLRERASH